ncbi:c-type cytochrome [Azotobacter beijerinckii]|uniref:c-type cytochrome n=1 Tax=Azotobacter beijerinckii TaxID=170623 RepID=UPI002954E4D1|nr:cytochrome c [Azotobacter beijerinckii]MDV7212896.1 cytochrome c [Azotobacter beijerinckii]
MSRLPLLVAALLSGAACAGQAQPPADGQQLYRHWCGGCHAKGSGNPGTMALDALYQGARPADLEERTDLQPEYVKYIVRNGRSTMPTWRKAELDDVQLQAIADYLKPKSPPSP